MPGPAFATGDDVSLHPIEEADYEFLQRGRNDPSTRIPLTNTLIRRREDVAERVEDAEHYYLICESDQREATGESDTPERVGVVAFTHVSERAPRAATLMYWVAPAHRGNGYASEAATLLLDYAFGECGFHKVVAQTLVSNDASVAALETLGFQREGRLVDEEFVDGAPADVYRYGLLAEEWLE